MLEQAARRRVIARGEPLFLAGQPCPCLFVINEGLVKMVYETAAGDMWVKGFAEPGICFASLNALEPAGRTSFSAYAELDSCVDQIDYAVVMQLADRHMAWQRAIGNALKIYGQRKERREMELLTLSPEERYRKFVQDHPHLVAVLRQRDIASFIRVTPVALSRIKSRQAEIHPDKMDPRLRGDD